MLTTVIVGIVAFLMGMGAGFVDQKLTYTTTKTDMTEKARKEAAEFAANNPGTRIHEIKNGKRLEIVVE